MDLCFVVALHLDSALHGLSALTENQLVDAFDKVCGVVEPESAPAPGRATHAIRRLREQGLLTRVDGAGVLRSGEFALSRLASGIVDFFIEDEALTEHSLQLLANTLLASLGEVREAARRARGDEQWQAKVVGPLRITAAELMLGIERRQRSLDAKQEHFQRRISELLSASWFDAVQECQEILDSTAKALQQLAQLLLHYARKFDEVLQDIVEAAIAADQTTAEAVAQRAMGQVDRIVSWGSQRQRAWSQYYESVHRYLRDIVRLDPSRALTQRLRQQLTSAQGGSALVVASAAALCVPRALAPVEPPPPVRRPRSAKPEGKPEVVPAPPAVDPLQQSLSGWIDEGVRELSELTARATEGESEAQHYRIAGRVAELAAKLGEPLAEAERAWVPVRSGLAIEQWQVEPAVGGSRGERR